MVECYSYTVAECMKDAHVLVWLDGPLCGVFIYEVLPIEMLPILISMMNWVLGHFNLGFVKDHS